MKAKLFVATVALMVLLIFGSERLPGTQAQSGGTYDLTWNVVGGGGATFATGGAYSLGGTIGQADAGALSGGAYTLAGGFWGGAGRGGSAYLPLIVR
jgi:hypothetical protein